MPLQRIVNNGNSSDNNEVNKLKSEKEKVKSYEDKILCQKSRSYFFEFLLLTFDLPMDIEE